MLIQMITPKSYYWDKIYLKLKKNIIKGLKITLPITH